MKSLLLPPLLPGPEVSLAHLTRASLQIWVCSKYSMFCFTAWEHHIDKLCVCQAPEFLHRDIYSCSASSLLRIQVRTAWGKRVLAVWGRYFDSRLCKVLCKAETVHVQGHTYNYPSLICFAVDGMCSVSSSSACRMAASYSTLVIVCVHILIRLLVCKR